MSDNHERWTDRFRAAYETPVDVDPTLRHRIAESIRRAERPRVSLFQVKLLRLRLLGRWLFEPLPVTLTPVRLIAGVAGGLVVLSLVLANPALLLRGPQEGRVPLDGGVSSNLTPGLSSVSQGAELVRFVFRAPRGAAVALVGDFNGWDPAATPMQMLDAEGIWSASILLPPGRHVYAFVIDGSRWVPDPTAPLAPEDGFGSRNSVVLVGGANL